MPGYTNDMIIQLMEAIASLETPEDCLALFDDLCTIKELQDMAQRFETAIQLSCGRNYRSISESVGVSTATISRVSRCLNYGSGGYRKAIDSIRKTENK